MKTFWGLGVPTLLFSACLKETVVDVLRARRSFGGIMILGASALFSTVTAKAQDSFSAAEPITGVYGSITNNNAGIPPETGGPSIAGYGENAPLWYAWTAPQSGVVEMDTLGSEETNFFVVPLDTVMAVYSGNSLSSLTQVAANDDLYPVPQQNETYPENIFDLATNYSPIEVGSGRFDVFEYYSGPSGLRFNAVGGQTYYIAVDSKAQQFNYIFGDAGYTLGINLGFNTGPMVLTWAYQPSGVFRFATENFDLTGNFNSTNSLVPPPLIPTCQTETSFQNLEVADHPFTYGVNQYNVQVHSYYPYNVAGVPVTITRVGGSSGRVWLTYSTQDGDTNLIQNGDEPAKAGRDYTPETNQTLIFDDGEMSKTIYVPIIDNSVADGGKWHANRDFTIAITNVQLDPYEDGSGDSASVSPPRIDNNFGQVEVRILDVDVDPKGPQFATIMSTNITSTTTNITTNTVWNIEPTNAVLNFAKVNYRFPRDVTNYWNSGGGGTLVTVWVTRRGTNEDSVSAFCSVDNGFLANGDPGNDEIFALEPASDYANPDPPSMAGVTATNSDFTFEPPNSTYAQIPVNFPASTSGHGWDPQPVQFLVYDNGNATLDKDFIIDLYEVDSHGNLIQPGMVAQTKVTILAGRAPVTSQTPADNRLPAGSVDENYNIDFGLQMAPPINTQPQNNPNPGTDEEVDGLVVLTNNETLAVGSFDSYNEVNRYGICLINTNGSLDQSFNPGSGANVFNTGLSVNTVAMTPDNRHAIIAGSFTSYNGTSVGTSQSEFQSGGVCRVNLNGSIDGTFQPGSGPNDSVYAVAVQPNGQILIGGAFTQYDGVTRNYLARLNANGSLDTTFDPGTTLNGPVYALDVQQTANITTNVVSTSGNARENDASINVSPNSHGNVIVNYIFPTTNDLQVYYGGTLIFDTGPTATGSATPAQFSVPYGPGNTPILLVANPGGALATGTNYSYGAVVTSAGSVPEVMVG
ncbi:MAG TPA: Calx-beta domain-containing protein, partial [Verrucomicrobiae bacterium]